ncbi:MAG: flagellar export chaperone FliS [Thioalkalivibrionaceae bacterium]
MYAMMNRTRNPYLQSGARSEATVATPHRLVQMLFESLLEKLAVAKGAMARRDTVSKIERIDRALEILHHLRALLDHDRGGEVAANLDALYEYASARLFEANRHDDIAALDEVVSLIREIKSGWDGIKQSGDPRTSVQV